MTSNQIAYATGVEGVRHDKVVEQETQRHDLALESLQEQQLKLEKARIITNAIGTVVGAVSTVGKLGTDIGDLVLKGKQITNAKEIADVQNKLRALEIDKNWNAQLLHEINVATNNANQYSLGLMQNWNTMRSITETSRSNLANEQLKATQIANTYEIDTKKIANEAKSISNALYIDKLNNLNSLESLNIKSEELKLKEAELILNQEKLKQEKELRTKERRANLLTAIIHASGSTASTVLGAASKALLIAAGM